jgi:hypothetical protein
LKRVWTTIVLFQIVFGSSGNAEELILRFGEHLYQEGDYYRAITEYKRYIYQNPDSEKIPWIKLRIGQSYLKGKKLQAAWLAFDELRLTANESRLKTLSDLATARVLYLQGRLEQSLEILEQIKHSGSLDYRGSGLYLTACLYLRQGRLKEARNSLNTIWAGHQLAEPAMQLDYLIEQADDIEQKSPLVAGLFSIFPGLGHVYLGEYSVALTAFSWNALFGFATFDAFKKKQIGVGVLLASLELLWYSGSIYGAISGAYRYNRDARMNYIESLDKEVGLDVNFLDDDSIRLMILGGSF